ncbi:alpha/beta hydrolase-fold protein [Glycomyces sp. NPDC049804]|uniref:alpha/beta hydrolase n=1 Tax=Glycomyces sp. NPDC049804 TaxID=3154363 RepID=UPI00341329FB
MTTRIAPTTEDQYNLSADPGQRAPAGLSMGSGHTLSTLWAHPGEFAYIGAMSAFGSPPAGADVDAVNAGTELIRVYSGDRQDFTYVPALNLIAAMENRGIEHEFAPIVAGPHGWDVWQQSLIDFLPRLFTSWRCRPGPAGAGPGRSPSRKSPSSGAAKTALPRAASAQICTLPSDH